MSKYMEEFIQTFQTTGRVKKANEEFRRNNKKRAEKIDKLMARFK